MKCIHILNDNAQAEFRFSVNIKNIGRLDDGDVLWLCKDCYDRLIGALIVDVFQRLFECLNLQQLKSLRSNLK